jgi:O-antigen/teichoic acid export membrane protein
VAKVFANSIRNLAGAAIPAAINLVTIPFIVRALGDNSYGALVLITSIIGYFSLLDINVTSGSVKYVAEHNALGERQELLEVISFGGLIYVFIGVAGAALIYLFAEFLTSHVFAIPFQLRGLFVSTLRVAAFGFFVAQMQIYLNSIPQSFQRYDITAILEVSFGIGVPFGTVALLWLGAGLWGTVLFRVVASTINVLLLLAILYRLIPNFHWVRPSNYIARKVASFSGYAYLSRIAAVTYNHADKLIIGALVNMSELTYYSVPSTLVNRLFGLTFRMGSVLYPVASELDALGDHNKLESIYLTATRYLTYVNTFFALIITIFAYQILYWWIGKEFAMQGKWVMIALTLAMLMDSVTNLPSLFNDGLGYPKRTGVFAFVRAICSLPLTFFLTRAFGFVGAALSHLIASIISTMIFLVYVHQRSIPVTLGRVLVHGFFPSALVAIFCWALVLSLTSPESQSLIQFLVSASVVTVVYIAAGMILIVEPAHKRQIYQLLKRLIGQT